MSAQVDKKMGKRCVTCRFSRDPRVEHSKVIDVKTMTCARDQPFACRPWNSCKFWESKDEG